MKITKSQLRRIIKEEKTRVLAEQWGNKESLSPLVAFGQAWSSLGGAVQEQVIDLVNAHIEDRLQDAVYEINPNALDMAVNRLSSVLRTMELDGSEEASELLVALDEAQTIYTMGDEEGEADA